MTKAQARDILHSAAQVREAVATVAAAETEAVLLSWSEQVYGVMQEERIGPADIAARGGPSERTITLMLKASNPRLSTMVEFVTALGDTYALEVKIVKAKRKENS